MTQSGHPQRLDIAQGCDGIGHIPQSLTEGILREQPRVQFPRTETDQAVIELQGIDGLDDFLISPEITSCHVAVPIRLNRQTQGPGRTGYDRPLAAPALEHARFQQRLQSLIQGTPVHLEVPGHIALRWQTRPGWPFTTFHFAIHPFEDLPVYGHRLRRIRMPFNLDRNMPLHHLISFWLI